MCSDRGDLTADGPAHAALDEGDLTQVINDSADGRPLYPADSERLYEQMRKVVRRVRRSRASRRDPATTVLLHEVWIGFTVRAIALLRLRSPPSRDESGQTL